MTLATRAPVVPGNPMEYDPSGFYDEAFLPDGRPRAAYAQVLEQLAQVDLHALTAAIATDRAARAVTFGAEGQRRIFNVDPVPRIFERAEWTLLEHGLAQRARALNRFLDDVYGERRIVAAGVVPARVIDGADHFEPWMLDVPVACGHAPIVGFDVVRGADGVLRVLEDNLRTPSGFTYAVAARGIADRHLPPAARLPRAPIDPFFERIGELLRAAAPDGSGDPSIVLLSDGPSNDAWCEHVALARRLAIPIARPGDLRSRGGRLYVALPSKRLREVQVVYRRTDEDRLSDPAGRPTWLAEAMLEAVRGGTVSVVNGFGSGVADDKLVHAYVEEMIRFYLREEPVLESVRTYDLGRPEHRTRALGRLGAMVVKPRAGHGGNGVVIGVQCTKEERDCAAEAIREQPDRFVAQETVALSRHPTVRGGRLVPRHVDLRAFAIGTGRDTRLVPGGLTRVALERDSLIVNTSQTGGGKDTWVVE